MKLLWRLTGGRPMIRESFAFTDKVNFHPIYYWRDRLGRRWMAEGAWSGFRIKPGAIG